MDDRIVGFTPGSCELSSLHQNFQTVYGVHPVSFPMRAGGSFALRDIGRYVKLTTHLHQGPRLRMRGAIPPVPTHLRGVVLNQAQEQHLWLILTGLIGGSYETHYEIRHAWL